jgi:hypothetical protein
MEQTREHRLADCRHNNCKAGKLADLAAVPAKNVNFALIERVGRQAFRGIETMLTVYELAFVVAKVNRFGRAEGRWLTDLRSA